jgi:Na+/proline symporter
MVCYVIRSFITSAVYILGPSTALSLVLGLETYYSITVIFVIGTFYTCVGGIKAVVWTDLFQAFIMISFIGVLLGKGIYEAGGVENVYRVSQENGRINFFNFDLDPTARQTFWNLFVASVFTSSLIYYSGGHLTTFNENVFLTIFRF